jgi:uncharacterized protein YidB (DUF937 family)
MEMMKMNAHEVIRVHQLATALGIDSKRVLKLAREYGVDVRSASSRLSAQVAQDIYYSAIN